MKFFPNIKKKWKGADALVKEAALLLSIAIVIILSFPIIFIQSSPLGIDLNNTGQIGDTIGGILAPFIAIIAAVLTFAAFYIQYQANQIQIKNFQHQVDISNVQRFESKFIDLIKLHRSNVEDINIKNKFKGREAFSELFYELRYTFYTLKKVIEDLPKGTKATDLGFKPDDDETIFKISYGIFFLGLNVNFKSSLINYIKNYSTDFFIQILIPYLEKIQSGIPHQIKFNNGFELNYTPYKNVFDGCNSNLGHYYRHLFQSVKFVDEMDNKLLIPTQKYNYVKTLRAQLSNFEQLLLYYNSLSYFGYPWLNDNILDSGPSDFTNGFLVKYKMIKNIPLPLADFGIKPEEKFKKEIEILSKNNPPEELFEWHEFSNRI